MEHGGEHKHTPQELREECLQIKREIEKLKAKTQWTKGPGFERVRAQTETDINFLEGKYKEAECDKVIASTPEPSKSEQEESVPQPSSGEKTHKETTPITPLSFDECFKKCKELTNRTNEECFDSCLHR